MTPIGGWFCNVCAHEWASHDPRSATRDLRPASRDPRPASRDPRYRSIDDLVARTGLRRDELATLADIGALNAFGCDRRSALWQIERAARPSGELFEPTDREPPFDEAQGRLEPVEGRPVNSERRPAASPLRPMTLLERVMADYDGTA